MAGWPATVLPLPLAIQKKCSWYGVTLLTNARPSTWH